MDGDDLIIGQKLDSIDLTPEKYDICILIAVVNDLDTGKRSKGLTSSIFVT